jgi:hypothetical protein
MFKTLTFIFLISFSHFGRTELVYQDALILKVVDKIYSVQDLKKIYQNYLNLKCFFEDEKIGQLASLQNGISEQHFSINKNLSAEQKLNYNKLKILVKLLTYVEAQNISIDQKIISSLFESYQALECSPQFIDVNNNKKVNKIFEQLLKLHIFLKSRYQAANQNSDTKELSGLSLFVDSIDKQLSDSFYWQE